MFLKAMVVYHFYIRFNIILSGTTTFNNMNMNWLMVI